MFMYKAAYYFDDDGVTVRVLDFPAVISCGQDLAEARRMVRSAIAEVAEYYIETGRSLPLPNPSLTDLDAELVEPLYLLLSAASQVEVIPQEIPA